MRRLFCVICLSLCLPFFANAQTYSLNGVKENVIIDVRTPQEFSEGHIDGAINIPYDQIESNLSLLNKIKKEDNILLYCRSGHRAGIAKQTLGTLGYKNVQNGGGMDSLMPKLKACKSKDC